MTAHDKIALLQRRLRSMRCRDVGEQECLDCADSGDEVQRKLGVPADKTEIVTRAGVRHFVGDFKNDKGQYLLRIISVEGHPHWPPATMPELMWGFMKHYRRDPETKELIID